MRSVWIINLILFISIAIGTLACSFNKYDQLNGTFGTEYLIRKSFVEGGCGTMYLGTARTKNNTIYNAIIKVPKNEYQGVFREELRNNLEIKIWQNTERFVLVEDYKIDHTRIPWMAFKYYQKSDLINYIKTFKHRLSLKLVSGIAYSLLNALKEIHSHGYVFYDLKPENVVITREFGFDRVEVKLIDFAFMKRLGRKIPTFYGTITTIAPEILLRSLGFPIGTESDMWSLGATLHMIYRKTLLIGLESYKPYKKVVEDAYYRFYEEESSRTEESIILEQYHDSQLSYLTECSCNSIQNHISCNYGTEDQTNYCDFILSLLRIDPKQRITLPEALSHPFIQKYNH